MSPSTGRHKKKKGKEGYTSLVRKWVGHKAMARVLDYGECKRPTDRYKQPPTIGMEVAVECMDVRYAWGNAHVLIRPVFGNGTVWVSLDRLRVVPQWPHEKKK